MRSINWSRDGSRIRVEGDDVTDVYDAVAGRLSKDHSEQYDWVDAPAHADAPTDTIVFSAALKDQISVAPSGSMAVAFVDRRFHFLKLL